MLLPLIFQFLTDANYHWRLAKNTFQLSQIYGAQGDPEKKKEYIYTSFDIAKVALGLDDQSANAHKWYESLCKIIPLQTCHSSK